LDIHKEVVTRSSPPPKEDSEATLQHVADKAVAASVIETFQHIVEAGVDLGFITTGDGMLFLKIGWDRHPMTLLYHLAEPKSEAEVHPTSIPTVQL
ncbi:hypothetical protein B0T26DRAFT_655676, partial [Lasiosphaeria miniovina]